MHWRGCLTSRVRGRYCSSVQGHMPPFPSHGTPDQSARYAVGPDLGVRRAIESVLGSLPGTERQKDCAHEFTTLPMRLGGGSAAFWASWADALPCSPLACQS